MTKLRWIRPIGEAWETPCASMGCSGRSGEVRTKATEARQLGSGSRQSRDDCYRRRSFDLKSADLLGVDGARIGWRSSDLVSSRPNGVRQGVWEVGRAPIEAQRGDPATLRKRVMYSGDDGSVLRGRGRGRRRGRRWWWQISSKLVKEVGDEPEAMLDGADGGEIALDLKAKAVGNSTSTAMSSGTVRLRRVVNSAATAKATLWKG